MKPILTVFYLFFFFGAQAQDSTNRDTIPHFDRIFTKVENEAQYPGGKDAWLHFLTKNLRYPMDAISNEIQGEVMVQFIVDTLGNTYDIQAISGPAQGGLREEAVRMIRLSGKWDCAIQNGYKVVSYKKQPVTFKIVYH